MVYKTNSFKWLLAGGFGIFLSAAIYSLNYNNKFEFDSLPASTECILVILYSILYFYEQMNNPVESFIYSSKNFWIIVGFFVYLASTLFLFIVAAYMSIADMEKFWFINFIANISKNILFAIAFSLPSGKKPIQPVKKKRNLH
jgi:hypothetical protein